MWKLSYCFYESCMKVSINGCKKLQRDFPSFAQFNYKVILYVFNWFMAVDNCTILQEKDFFFWLTAIWKFSFEEGYGDNFNYH